LSKVAGPRALSWRWDVTLFLLLILCGTLPYANTLRNSFVYIDRVQVLQNPYVRSFRYLPQILNTSVWSFQAGPVSNYYRPMMTIGYLLCYKLFGFAPWGFHLANVLLHTAVVCLLFFVTWRMFRDRGLALVAAAVFSLHPIHAESVAWIGAVTELELTFFYLFTFWCFLAVARPGGKRSERTYLGLVVSFVFALLSKEQALTLPFLATVYEHFYREDRAETSRAQKFGRYAALWLLAIAYVLCRVRFVGAFAPHVNFPNLTLYQTCLSALALVGQYLWKLVWPVRLSAFYVFHPSVSLLEQRVLCGALAGLIACAGLFLYLWKHTRMASFGLVWILVTLAPVLNPHWLGLNVFTEHYLYLPSVGFCWVLARGLNHFRMATSSHRPAWRSALAGSVLALAVLCALRIISRNREWNNNLVLYTKTLATSPDADLIRNALALEYKRQGNLEGAERQWRQVLEHEPKNVDCLNNLGQLFVERGLPVTSLELLLQAIKANPSHAQSHLNLGLLYMGMGQMEQAEPQLRAAVALAPGDPRALGAVGLFYWKRGERSRAERALKLALSINPFYAGARLLLANLYAQEGRSDEATREYGAAVSMHRTNLDAGLVEKWEPIGLNLSPDLVPQRTGRVR
jgi:Tfp pilus assembly protein PilF